MASAANMGGLFAAVTLDTGAALLELRKLRKEFEKIFKTSSGKQNSGLKKVQQETKAANTELKKASESTRKWSFRLRKVGKDA